MLRTHVARRAASYLWRIRVPCDLVPVVGRAELKRSLKTSDPGLARRRGAELSASIDALWCRLRTTVEHSEVEALVKAWLSQKLAADMVARSNTSFAQPFSNSPDDVGSTAARMLMDDSEARLEEAQALCRDHRWSDMSAEADHVLRKQQTSPDHAAPWYGYLCMLLAAATVELEGVRLERSHGHLHVEPRNPVFRGEQQAAIAPTKAANPPKRLARAVKAPAEPLTSKTLETETTASAIRRYLKERQSVGVRSKRLLDLRNACDFLAEVVTPERPIASINKLDMGRVRELIVQIPTNRRKILGDMSIEETIKQAKLRGLQRLSVETIKSKYLRLIDGFLRWCAEGGLIEENPASGIKMARASKRLTNRRLPYRTEHLQAMFSSPLFTGCQSTTKLHDAGGFRIDDHRKWIPLLGLFTGARLNELCQLRVADIKVVDRITCIEIEEGDSTMRVKSEAGRRIVPLHAELIRLGFESYVERMRTAKSERLFPGLTVGAGGYFSDNFTKRYAGWLKRALGEEIVARDCLKFHSFRHAFKDAMRQAGIEEPLQNRIIGHEDRHVGAGYGIGYRPERLLEAINKVEFEGLDLRHLYEKPERLE